MNNAADLRAQFMSRCHVAETCGATIKESK
jgi:hypothetical protein